MRPRTEEGAEDEDEYEGLAYRTKVPLSESTNVMYFCWLGARDLTWVLLPRHCYRMQVCWLLQRLLSPINMRLPVR